MNEYELYHYGVKGMKWGVRRQQKKIDKYLKKARQYEKYSKEYAKEGSRRYGSDGARQTDQEIAWMKKLAADNKAKSQKYEAKAKKIEEKRAFREDVKYVKENLAGSTVDFYNKRTTQKGKAYVDKVYSRAGMELIASGTAQAAGAVAVAAALYKLANG